MKTVKEQYFELRELYRKAATEAERSAIEARINDLKETHPEEYAQAYSEEIHSLVDKTKALITKEELAEVLPFLPQRYVAKTYFGKSASWFGQRLNGATVGGWQAHFSEEDLARLESALHDIGRKFLAVRLTKNFRH